jgi:hypothetical protein
MYKMILISALLAALLVSAGCTSQETGSPANASGGHIVSTAPNASGQQASQPAGNATANITPAQNGTPSVINQTPNNSAIQCAYVAPPSAEQQVACSRNVSVYIQIKDSSNCTTGYRCMNSVARVRYDLSRISIQDKACPPVITDDIIYAAANTCGAEYDHINVAVGSTYAYVNGSTCAKSISINCTSISTFVRSTQ